MVAGWGEQDKGMKSVFGRNLPCYPDDLLEVDASRVGGEKAVVGRRLGGTPGLGRLQPLWCPGSLGLDPT